MKRKFKSIPSGAHKSTRPIHQIEKWIVKPGLSQLHELEMGSQLQKITIRLQHFGLNSI